MPLTVNVAAQVDNAWVRAKCVGFKEGRNGDSLLCYFRGPGDELFSKPLHLPVRLREINELRKACGLPLLKDVQGPIQLPQFGDDSSASMMMGYDREIEIFARHKGGYSNADRIRSLSLQAADVPASSPNDDLPF